MGRRDDDLVIVFVQGGVGVGVVLSECTSLKWVKALVLVLVCWSRRDRNV